MVPLYLPISLLKEKAPYRIMEIHDSGRHILLQIRDYNCPQHPIEMLLLNPQMVEAFRWAEKFNQQKNREVSLMRLKYYGYATSNDAGYPIVKIFGRRFFKYLIPSA
jgi:hypothetical protein